MSDEAWKRRQQALEEGYFQKLNQEALERLQERDEQKPRLSPISGEPMEQETFMGVVIDRCKQSGGIWLDAGELDQIISHLKDDHNQEEREGWAESFLSFLRGSDKK